MLPAATGHSERCDVAEHVNRAVQQPAELVTKDLIR
jgi:hypothetical protein